MSRFRFLVRFLALTGLLAAGAGAIYGVMELQSWAKDDLIASAKGENGQAAQIASCLMAGGLLVAAALVLFDMLLTVGGSAVRRSALGTNVAIQVALAIVLLIGVNIFSFANYNRWDCTRLKVFTLNPETAEQLKQLRASTTVIVYQTHKPAGLFSDKPDQFDNAAEAKVVEKIRDLIDQIRELGPQFEVVILDGDDKRFERKLAREKERFPGLDAVVAATQESSIFFCDGKHIQRMSFSEFYRLDKTASKQADGNRGNLVLWNQGVEPFARRILSIAERKPRIALLVSHPLLSSEGQINMYTLAGLKKSLTDSGFEVRDILTMKIVRGPRGFSSSRAALSIDESRLNRVEAQLSGLRLQILMAKRELERSRAILDLLQSSMPAEERDKRLSELEGFRIRLTSEELALNRTRFAASIPELEQEQKKREEKEQQLQLQFETLLADDSVAEGQNETDLRRKMNLLLADCDALIVPRMTMVDANIADVPNSVHRLDDSQLAAVKDFMKSGKPVLFCLGPINQQPEGEETPDRKPPPPAFDNLESMLAEVGFDLSAQVVVYEEESEAYAANQVMAFGRGGGAEAIPSLEIPTREVTPGGPPKDLSKLRSNRLAQALWLVQRGADKPLDLRFRFMRPVYFRPTGGNSETSVSFLQTSRSSWNEMQPFPTDDRPAPTFSLSKSDDPAHGTIHERRRGPLPVGVAVETVLPRSWMNTRLDLVRNAMAFVPAALLPARDWPAPPMAGVLVQPIERTAERLSQSVNAACMFIAAALLPAVEPPAKSLAEALAATAGFGTPPRSRLAAIGHGGWFTGAKLEPAQEALLLNTVNWLVKRDDRLPRHEKLWTYPRADLSETVQLSWTAAALLGLPGLFAYFGLTVLMLRRVR